MGFIDILKGIKNKSEKIDAKLQIYNEILEIMDSLKEYDDEIKNLKGHTHFAVVEAEEKILKLIDKDESVLRIQGAYDKNIGMEAVEHYKLTRVISRALDDEISSTQQNVYGKNIGMMCAGYGLEELTLKALDNTEASIQQDELGLNVGYAALLNNMENCVYKSLDNEEAANQCVKNSEGVTLAMEVCLAAYERCALKILDNRNIYLKKIRRAHV